ncbi:MAG TPA: hypothetical protein DHV14_13975 [Micrococcales bacterium]|uniref:hypothetical protein n=1 Tax=Miniimonas arenae TaxID=676201 RepID=UPI000ECC5EE9|nr:hypothetical protein [Miniimonas arenae]HCX86210.1 hypothetical protein [Micrococcales bacterium]
MRIVSTSDEAFADLRAWLVKEDGTEVDFPLGFNEIGPHEDKRFTVYYAPGQIGGNMRVRIRFRDANGRRWERTNGEPVRELHDDRGRRGKGLLRNSLRRG